MGCAATKIEWTDYQTDIATKPRGLDAADADRLMRAVWLSYMNPAGFGEVRPQVAPSWMIKSTNHDGPEPVHTPLKMAEVLKAGMGGAWPTMKMFDVSHDQLLKFFSCDPDFEDNKLIGFFDYPETCTQAVFAHSWDEKEGGHLLLSCRGSTSKEDWKTNGWGMKTRFEPQLDEIDCAGDPHFGCFGGSKDPQLDKKRKELGIGNQGRVHRGFYEAFLPLRKAIDGLLVETCMCSETQVKQVTIVGHSLGGALATLSLAYFLMRCKDTLINRGIKVTSFTVGSPRVGDEEFRNFVFKNANGLREQQLFRQYRAVLDKDIVASVPPFRLGYRHQGRVCKIAQSADGSFSKLMFKKGQVVDQVASASEVVNLSGHWVPPTYPGADLITDHQVPEYFANILAAHKDYMGERWSYNEKEEKPSQQDGVSEAAVMGA